MSVIPDGNRRYASKYGLELKEAYSVGMSNCIKTIAWAKKKGIKNIVFYVYSKDNYFKRPVIERELILRLFQDKAMEALITPLEEVDSDITGVKLTFVGEMSKLPPNLCSTLQELSAKTKGNNEIEASFAILSSSPVSNNKRGVYPHPIDLMFRSGGFRRLSDFLPQNHAYAELYFEDKLWPEVKEEDLDRAYHWYNSQERNLGQ